jgi:hypothetical protein
VLSLRVGRDKVRDEPKRVVRTADLDGTRERDEAELSAQRLLLWERHLAVEATHLERPARRRIAVPRETIRVLRSNHRADVRFERRECTVGRARPELIHPLYEESSLNHALRDLHRRQLDLQERVVQRTVVLRRVVVRPRRRNAAHDEHRVELREAEVHVLLCELKKKSHPNCDTVELETVEIESTRLLESTRVYSSLLESTRVSTVWFHTVVWMYGT